MGIDGEGECMRDAVGTEALQESGDIAGLRKREGIGVTVMGDEEAKEFVSNGMGFDMLKWTDKRQDIRSLRCNGISPRSHRRKRHGVCERHILFAPLA